MYAQGALGAEGRRKAKSVKSKNNVKAMTYFAFGNLVLLQKCVFFSCKRKKKINWLFYYSETLKGSYTQL